MNAALDPPLYDAHNHLQDAWLAPHRAQVFAALARLPLRRAVVNGTSETDWNDVAALAREHAFVLPSYGLHPWNLGHATPHWRDALRAQLDRERHATIGEIGLDRWILDRAKPDDPRLAGLRRAPLEEQLDAFAWQLALAAERNVPASIHCLDAWGVLLDTLRRGPRPARGFLLHAYGGSAELAREFAALGAYFSFNGYFLGERQAAKRSVFKNIPLDRLLAETDAPAMPLPAALRSYELPGLADGNPINHPANIGAVYAGLAELRGISRRDLAQQLEKNFLRLFGATTR
ncbi:MAG TPA: TatD family hydrolase [Opitutaceae bacterium]|nr:TatD family hydrolase [Opitutaceae bacterium]